MLVLDTSAAVAALVQRHADPSLIRRLSEDEDLHAPHLIDVEILHALRGLVRGGKLGADRAEDARADFRSLAITRYGHEALADRIWSFRNNLSVYDAAFVALAALLEVPLVTCDRRLAGAPGVSESVSVELFDKA